MSPNAAARRQLQAKGFDGTVAMKVVAVQQGAGMYVPGNDWNQTSRDLYAFWGPSWVVVDDPGYRVDHCDVTVETRIYSLADNKLVWAGRTKTDNQKSVDDLVQNTADAVGAQLRQQGSSASTARCRLDAGSGSREITRAALPCATASRPAFF